MDQYVHRSFQSSELLLVHAYGYSWLYARSGDHRFMPASFAVRSLPSRSKRTQNSSVIRRHDLFDSHHWLWHRCGHRRSLIVLRSSPSPGLYFQLQFLLIIQLRNICQNRTAIEHWIIAKARERDHRRIEPFVFPFNLGLKENFRQVFNWSNNFRAIGDGLAWPVQAGCHLYALTQEQLHQAYEKNHSAVRYDVIKSYPGSWCPLSYGLPTCIFLPHFTETRIPIEQGDAVLVTRWKTYWLYGDRVTLTEDQRVRGWFPRSCINESLDTEDRQHKAPSKSRVKQSKKQH